MRDLIRSIFDTSFMPHGGCYLWLRGLVRLHVISDSIIAVSYYSIPITLLYLARKKRDIPYRYIFLMFGAFIVACGTTHLMEVITVYIPVYWVSGGVKAVTAMLSVATAIALIPLVPQALLLQGPEMLKKINRNLEEEIERRKHSDQDFRENEDQKKKEELKFKGLLEASPDALVIIDPQCHIVLLNAQSEKLFGYTREELFRQPLDLIVPESCRALHPVPHTEHFKNSHVWPMKAALELKARRKDGSEFPSEIIFSPMETGEDLLVTAVIRDVTARLRHGDDLENLRRKADEANRLKSEFLANMSHELRTPLNSMIGFSEFIHDGKAGPVTANQKEYLGDVLGSAHHLLQLINDILDLAKVEAGKIEFRSERVSLEMLTKEVCGSLRTAADAKKIELIVEVNPGMDDVRADPARLKQVLFNYLSNALKFTPNHGNVCVRVQPEGESSFRISVQDNGRGILPEDLDRLFVAFQQLDASASKEFQGTGLGLALSKKIVEAQGGRVGVESVPGQGAVFYVVLPR